MKRQTAYTLFIIKKPMCVTAKLMCVAVKPLCLLAVMLLTIAAIMFMACGGRGDYGSITFSRLNEAAHFETSELKTIQPGGYLPDEELCLDVKLEMDFLTPHTAADSSVCANINGYITGQLLGQPDEGTPTQAMQGYIERMKKDFIGQEYLMVCYDEVTGTAEYGLRGIINYTYREEYFGGGAHPTTNVIVKRFNTTTGQPVELWDVFADTCSTALEDLLTRRLMEQQKVRTVDDLHEMGYLDMVDMFVPKNFWMYEDSVTFFFNQYDIAPYALGQTCLTFSYAELKPYMR